MSKPSGAAPDFVKTIECVTDGLNSQGSAAIPIRRRAACTLLNGSFLVQVYAPYRRPSPGSF
eukprot:3506926-Amphidinium_carterae.1